MVLALCCALAVGCSSSSGTGTGGDQPIPGGNGANRGGNGANPGATPTPRTTPDATPAVTPTPPEPGGRALGSACGRNADCRGEICISDFPGGYCSSDCGAAPCEGGVCLNLAGNGSRCLKSCTGDADCARSDGYACNPEGLCVPGTPAPAECGNGVREGDETCDGRCPVRCDDGDPCTDDRLVGSAANCDARCEHPRIAGCSDLEVGVACDGDAGCPGGICLTDFPRGYCSLDCSAQACPEGTECWDLATLGPVCLRNCQSSSECRVNERYTCDEDGTCFPDLSPPDPECGNGILEEGETCDGDCPQSCDDGDPCTTDRGRGSAANCNYRCEHEPVFNCEPRLGARCENDSDCDAGGLCITSLPGGYCSFDCDDASCVVGSCWTLPGEGARCLRGCASDFDCRWSEGYACGDDDTCVLPPGPRCGNGVVEEGETCDGNCDTECEPDDDPCTFDGSAGLASRCNFRCTHEPITGCDPTIGAPCTRDSRCGEGNRCVRWANGGFCTRDCGEASCAQGICDDLDYFGEGEICLAECSRDADCRLDEGYVCRDGGCVPAVVVGSICGDGVVQTGEQCDGDCPTRCDDLDPCTDEVLIGDPDQCTSRCEATENQSCENGIVAGSTLSSRYVVAGARYLASRNWGHLSELGVLEDGAAAVARRADGSDGSRADDRITPAELLTLEQPAIFQVLLPEERAGLEALWELMRLPDTVPEVIVDPIPPSNLVARAVHEATGLTHPHVDIAGFFASNSSVQQAMRRTQLVFDSDNNPDTVNHADVAEALADTLGRFNAQDIALFEIAFGQLADAAVSDASAHVVLTAPGENHLVLGAGFELDTALSYSEQRSSSGSGSLYPRFYREFDRRLSIVRNPGGAVVLLSRHDTQEFLFHEDERYDAPPGRYLIEQWHEGERLSVVDARVSNLQVSLERADLHDLSCYYYFTEDGQHLVRNLMSATMTWSNIANTPDVARARWSFDLGPRDPDGRMFDEGIALQRVRGHGAALPDGVYELGDGAVTMEIYEGESADIVWVERGNERARLLPGENTRISLFRSLSPHSFTFFNHNRRLVLQTGAFFDAEDIKGRDRVR